LARYFIIVEYSIVDINSNVNYTKEYLGLKMIPKFHFFYFSFEHIVFQQQLSIISVPFMLYMIIFIVYFDIINGFMKEYFELLEFLYYFMELHLAKILM
jgi:hypothetical protein